VRVDDESTIYVPIRPTCDYLSLDWSAQFRRIQRDEILAKVVKCVAITATPQEGGFQELLCLPLDLLPGWLFGVTTSRVKAEVKDKITRYRRECFRVLWEAFRPAILLLSELAPRPGQSGAAVAYELATAVANLAREAKPTV